MIQLSITRMDFKTETNNKIENQIVQQSDSIHKMRWKSNLNTLWVRGGE